MVLAEIAVFSCEIKINFGCEKEREKKKYSKMFYCPAISDLDVMSVQIVISDRMNTLLRVIRLCNES